MGHPPGAELSCSPLFFVCLISIRKCVYPVLCYNQCISFVAIEKYVDSLEFLFLRGGSWGMGNEVPDVRLRSNSEAAELVRRTPVEGVAPLHGQFGRMGVGKYYCSISNIHNLFLRASLTVEASKVLIPFLRKL